MGEITKNRKLEHILLAVERDVESKEHTLLEYVRLVHNPLPEADLDDVRLEKEFCGYKLGAPLMITGMTGGHPETGKINYKIGLLAEKYGLAVGVGSQRAAIEKPEVANTFRAMREAAPNAFIVANLGAPQLSKGYGVREARKAVEMIDANAIAIHLNVGQELFQAEGDPYYSRVIEKIVEIADSLDVPVIVKETGAGLSRETVRTLYRLGISCFDVSGLGGTSWIKVEGIRSLGSGHPTPGELSNYWGNPTALAVIEARASAPGAYIVGSGGIRTGLDAVKVLALGADLAGIALPVLKVLVKGGIEAASKYLETLIYQIKASVLMTGGRRPEDLWRAPITVWGRLREEAGVRGIDTVEYLSRTRLQPLLVRSGWLPMKS